MSGRTIRLTMAQAVVRYLAAQRGENLAAFGRADGPGLVSVLLIATERAIAEANRPGGTIGRIRTVTRAALDATGKLAENPTTRPHLPEVLLALSTISASAQPYLAKSDPGMWRDYVTEVQAALEKVREPAHAFLKAYAGFALVEPELYALMMARDGRRMATHRDLRAATRRVIGLSQQAFGGGPAGSAAQRDRIIALWSLLHGAIALYRAGLIRAAGRKQFADYLLKLAGNPISG